MLDNISNKSIGEKINLIITDIRSKEIIINDLIMNNSISMPVVINDSPASDDEIKEIIEKLSVKNNIDYIVDLPRFQRKTDKGYQSISVETIVISIYDVDKYIKYKSIYIYNIRKRNIDDEFNIRLFLDEDDGRILQEKRNTKIDQIL